MALLAGARLAFAALALIILYLSLIDDPDAVKSGFRITDFVSTLLFGSDAQSDKVAHFLSYLGLGAVGALARVPGFATFAPLTALLAAYGGAIEIAQGLGGVRDADLIDALVNLAGAAAGAAPVFALRAGKTAA